MENSKIEWTHHTFNPWIGCTKVSPACKFCYAERDMDIRFSRNLWGDGGARVATSEKYWRTPYQWDQKAKCAGVRQRVFCASLADVFEDWKGDVDASKLGLGNVPMPVVRERLFKVIDETQNLDYLFLTKRPENVLRFWHGKSRKNVWIGTSVESTAYTWRIAELASCRELAPVLFISAEPLLDALDIRFELSHKQLDWVIAGGESGPNARPSNADWFRTLRNDCAEYNVPFLFKQWGEHNAEGKRVGKRVAGRTLDGVIHDGFPIPRW